MHDREERQKRSLSSNFGTQASLPTISRPISHSTQKGGTKKHEQLQEQTLMQRIIENLPSGQSQWKMSPFEQKHNIPGFKSRLQWKWRPRDVYAHFKFSFSNNFFNQMHTVHQGDLIVELQEVNFELFLGDKRKVQEKIQQIQQQNVDKIKARGFGQQWRRQNQFLRNILIEIGEQLRKTSESRKKLKRPEKIDQKAINKRHILYPAPATFAWNPLGSLCITQNRYPIMRKPIIGEPLALQKYFQAQRQENRQNNATKQEGDDLQVNKGKQSVYDWKVNQEVSLFIFNQNSSKINQFAHSRGSADEEIIHKLQGQKVGSQKIDLGTLSSLSPKLRRAYLRFFGGIQISTQVHRYDKLKVYDIQSLSQSDQDDIVFLIQRISTRPPNTLSSQIAFQNHLNIYPTLLNVPIDQFRYKILSEQLRQDMNQPLIKFGAYLRMFILENDFFSDTLQAYFKQQYRRLQRLPHSQLYGLGSYCKFDRAKAEMIFMDLIKLYLVRHERLSNIKVEGIQIKRRFIPSQLCIEQVVSEQQKDQILRSLFPLLIVKDREMQRFQFKKIKKIISANACLISFIKKMNEIVIKFQQGKITFLKTILNQFYTFRQDLKDRTIQPHRIFMRTCTSCSSIVYFYTLPNHEEIQYCQRCKSRSFSQLF